MSQLAVPDDDAQRIIQAYEKSNEELRCRVKELEKQISSGEPGLKKENQALRHRIIELQTANDDIENFERLKQEHVDYVRKAKEREMKLREQNAILEVENNQLRENAITKWDDDETLNKSILSVISSLHEAYVNGAGIEEAMDNFVAIIAPDLLVKKERDVKQTRIPNKRERKLSGYDSRQQSEVQELRAEVEALKAKLEAPKASRVPVARAAVVQAKPPQKVKDLEEKIAEMQKKIDDMQQENANLKSRAKERSAKIRELTQQLQQTQDDALEEKRKYQLESNDKSMEKASMQAKLKSLEEDAQYRVEYEKLRARVEILEAENVELKKPRPTGVAAMDRVLDTINRMEGDIQQRQMNLSRMAMNLEDKFETEKRDLENKHRREIDEKNSQLRRLKGEFEAILADLEKSKKKKSF